VGYCTGGGAPVKVAALPPIACEQRLTAPPEPCEVLPLPGARRRAGRHARQDAYALTARRAALLAAGTAGGILAAMVIAAVLAALCVVLMAGTAILLAAIRVAPRWALWCGVVIAWPVAESWQAARILPAGYMPLTGAVAVIVASCAAGLAGLRAARQRQWQWRQAAGRMGRPEPEARTGQQHPGITDRLDALERSHAAMAASQAAIMEAAARALRAANVSVPAELRADGGMAPVLQLRAGGRSASLPARAAQVPVLRAAPSVARMARYIAMNSSACSRVRRGVSAMCCSDGSR
jgi:hypothetical protein